MKKAIAVALLLSAVLFSQSPFTWEQIKEKFEASNPTLRAAQLNIDESRAQEMTAFLRPNPEGSVGIDQIVPFNTSPSLSTGAQVYRPLQYVFPLYGISYMIERDHKRELRLQSARKSTEVASSTFADTERGLLFNLRQSFVLTLEAKAFQQNAKENLDYWDRELDVNRKRLQLGDLAQADLERLELQRVQFESDVITALVNLRTAKIQILQLLNQMTPVDRFDVTGPYDFVEKLMPVEQLHAAALASRPDLKAAMQNVELAQVNHKLAIANGSTDPTIGLDFGRNPPIPFYFGVNISIPLRIFDRNQGEKLRTQLDIARSEKTRDAARAQVFSDVDSSYATLESALALLVPYRDKYLKLAETNRNREEFSYRNGGASLLRLP